MVGPLVKLAEVRGAELDRKGGKGMRELEGKAAGDEQAFIPRTARAGRLGDSDTMPDTAGGEVVTGPLNRKA
jgi:hypothetical protein